MNSDITKDMIEEVIDSDDEVPLEKDVAIANKVVAEGLLRVSHGDAVHWLGPGYRNERLLFWHKKKGFIYPYTHIDDYGSVPPCFRVGKDFKPDHWLDSVSHNGIVFLDKELQDEIHQKLKPAEDGRSYLCGVWIQNEYYTVRTQNPDDDINWMHVMHNRELVSDSFE